MARLLAFSLRLSVIASAVAMLVLCVHAAHAQGIAPIDTTPSPPLGQNGAPDPYAYYKPSSAQTQGYYTALQPPSPQNAMPYQPTPTGPQYAPPSYAAAPSPQFMPAPQYASAPVPQYAAAPADAGFRADQGYTLGPSDKVRVSVYGEDDLSGEFLVDGNGMMRLPLIGTMRAVGYTASGLEAWIKSALANGYLKNPRVNVEIISYRPIYVVGAVTKPGQYPYANDMTMLNAVALAGGFNDQAVQSTLYVRHEGSTVEEPLRTDLPILIKPGDTVRVKTTLFWDAMNMFSPVAGPVTIAASAARW